MLLKSKVTRIAHGPTARHANVPSIHEVFDIIAPTSPEKLQGASEYVKYVKTKMKTQEPSVNAILVNANMYPSMLQNATFPFHGYHPSPKNQVANKQK
jgi:ketopantoate reductase